MNLRVETAGGFVAGVSNGETATWRGIPYAAPPEGELRFASPQPPVSWRGVRDGSVNGQIAWQDESTNRVETRPPDLVMSEDCLNLNIWAPAAAQPGTCPVFVWIHGGGFMTGSASGYWADGSSLARDQGIVVVALNYRLGALGGLSLEEAGTPGGTFVLDSIAALRWVQDNIASFGGDPGQVTVGGQSAGAMIVSSLLVSPGARGLFRAAVIQSGHGSGNWSLDQARHIRDTFAETLGIHPGKQLLEQLRHATPADLLRAQAAIRAAVGVPPFRPIVDGHVMARHPLEAVEAGGQHAVPVLLGTVRDEANLFTAMGWARQDGTSLEQRMQQVLTESAPDLVDELAGSYRSVAGSDDAAWNMIRTDHDWRRPNRDFAIALAGSGAPVYRYEFAYSSPACQGIFGACHSMELPFVFGNLYQPGVEAFTGSDTDSPARPRVAAQCTQAWGAFVRHGRPTSDALPDWPQYEPSGQQIMMLGPDPAALRDPHADRLDRWTTVPSVPPLSF